MDEKWCFEVELAVGQGCVRRMSVIGKTDKDVLRAMWTAFPRYGVHIVSKAPHVGETPISNPPYTTRV